MRRLLVHVLAAVVLTVTAAESQTIRGMVIEDSTRAPIADALVELIAPDSGRIASSRTDSTGAFQLTFRRTGALMVRLSHLAYAAVDSAALEVRSGETLQIELRMAHRAIPLEPLIVTSRANRQIRGFHERMERPGFGRFVSRDDIERRAATRATDLLRGLPGVYLTPVSGGSGNLITMRGGSGRCVPTIYLDGLELQQFDGSPLDTHVWPDLLEGVEVYQGFSAPSPILARNGCGVIAFWTRADLGRRFSWRRLATGAGFFGAMFLLTSILTR